MYKLMRPTNVSACAQRKDMEPRNSCACKYDVNIVMQALECQLVPHPSTTRTEPLSRSKWNRPQNHKYVEISYRIAISLSSYHVLKIFISGHIKKKPSLQTHQKISSAPQLTSARSGTTPAPPLPLKTSTPSCFGTFSSLRRRSYYRVSPLARAPSHGV